MTDLADYWLLQRKWLDTFAKASRKPYLEGKSPDVTICRLPSGKNIAGFAITVSTRGTTNGMLIAMGGSAYRIKGLVIIKGAAGKIQRVNRKKGSLTDDTIALLKAAHSLGLILGGP